MLGVLAVGGGVECTMCAALGFNARGGEFGEFRAGQTVVLWVAGLAVGMVVGHYCGL